MINRLFLCIAVLVAVACSHEEDVPGILQVDNPRKDKLVSVYGETVSVTVTADGAWTAELELKSEGDWAEISQVIGNGQAGQGTVRVRFSKNESEDERTADLYITVEGRERELAATFTQAAGDNRSAMSEYLNSYMHERLKKEYLWADEYAALDIDMSTSWDQFLYTHLTQLGNVNIEDGGYYRDYSSSAGKRYIYSYISEVSTTKSVVATKAGELAGVYGLGIGPLFSSLLEEGTDYVGLTVGYVYPGSPAAEAGLRRGDTIYKIGNTRITGSNYQNYMQELYSNPSGSYKISFARYESDDASDRYDLNLDHTIEVQTGEYGYNPILLAAILNDSNVGQAYEGKSFNIGYLVTSSFDSSAQEVLEYHINQFIEAGITDLILDLRFNIGGEVQQSRYLSSSIVGPDYDDNYFFKAEYNDGSIEAWKFKSGPAETDKLGQAPSMGLNRLWVIMSENTASASELVIHGLKGVGFPVTLIGSRSEGKNVGMVVTHEVYNGRRFEFAPITYRALNGKDEHAPSDGFEPDPGNMLNNQDNSYSNDIDNIFPYSFGDWGNFDFNIALYCCFCDIIGIDRPDYRNTKSADDISMQAFRIQNSVQPLGSSELHSEPGRFGSIIRR